MSPLREGHPAAVYTRSTSRSTTLMNPTRPRGMTRVTATFTHTATTITALGWAVVNDSPQEFRLSDLNRTGLAPF
jgi:hypothetical protein